MSRILRESLLGFECLKPSGRPLLGAVSFRRLFCFDRNVFGQVSVSQDAVRLVLVKNDKGPACFWRFQKPFCTRDPNQGAARCLEPEWAKRLGVEQAFDLRCVSIHGVSGRAYGRLAPKLRAKTGTSSGCVLAYATVDKSACHWALKVATKWLQVFGGANRKLYKSLILSWLPRMDSNHDKVIQSHLCYRYTTRQRMAGWLAPAREEFVTANCADVNCLAAWSPWCPGAGRIQKLSPESCRAARPCK